MSLAQIADRRAPFKTIDEAIEAGHDHGRRNGWSLRAMVAEPQPGGYFVRVVYETPIGRGGRAGRKRWQSGTVEIGKIDSSAFAPLNDTYLSGKPYYCDSCGFGGAEVYACEDGPCEMESVEAAQARLIKAHETGKGMPTP